KAYDTANKLAAYLDDMDLVTPFLRYAAARNVRGRYEFISPSIPMVQRDIKSNIARMLLGEDAFWMLYQDGDPMLGKAVEVIVKASNVVEADEE
ncbi:MAG: hypothetical protein GX619_04360, partial [Bacteroidales bacterium]|nr:hypothetical protein [Bacteroidales bacterium]